MNIQDLINRSSDSADLNKSSSHESKKETRSSDRTKKKSSWYNVLYPTYKSRSEDFKRIFKDVPDDERLVVGKYCLKSVVFCTYKNVLCHFIPYQLLKLTSLLVAST